MMLMLASTSAFEHPRHLHQHLLKSRTRTSHRLEGARSVLALSVSCIYFLFCFCSTICLLDVNFSLDIKWEKKKVYSRLRLGSRVEGRFIWLRFIWLRFIWLRFVFWTSPPPYLRTNIHSHIKPLSKRSFISSIWIGSSRWFWQHRKAITVDSS